MWTRLLRTCLFVASAGWNFDGAVTWWKLFLFSSVPLDQGHSFGSLYVYPHFSVILPQAFTLRKCVLTPFSCKAETESQISFEHLRAVIYGDVRYITYSLCKNVLKWEHPSLGCELHFLIVFSVINVFQCMWFVGRYTDKAMWNFTYAY